MDDSSKLFIPINGKLIPVTKELYDDYYKEARKELYQEEQAQENGVFSYDSLDNGRLLGANSLLILMMCLLKRKLSPRNCTIFCIAA